MPDHLNEMNQNISRVAEDRAKAFLIRQGHKIIDQNWRSSTGYSKHYQKKKGEIDIITISPNRSLCFVEVKSSRRYHSPEWAVNQLKRNQIKHFPWMF